MTTGREPRDFAWVITDRLAISARIGGQGFEHRRVRRSQEIAWLKEKGFTAVVSLLPGIQNVSSYEAAGLQVYLAPVNPDPEPTAADRAFAAIRKALTKPAARVLVHRDFVDDTVAGILAGYVVFAGLVADERIATIVLQEIIERPLGPGARALIPSTG